MDKDMKIRYGKVTLVGAGCGHGLITTAGVRALKNAGTLVFDDLIDKELLNIPGEGCRKIYAGKRSGKHSMSQNEINEILIREAMEGRNVVRLKGGDSFVFGRGGEEIEALKAHGINFSVIPGISSAIAVPENAGIPVTHRGMAGAFTVVTGNTADGKAPDLKYLADFDGTIVFLMGIKNIGKIAEGLIKAGKSPDTPSAVISRGFTPYEKRIDGKLSEIAALSENAATPGVFVVGETAGLNFKDGLRLPLSGVRAVITGTESFVERLSEGLAEYGAECIRSVSMRIRPMYENIPESFELYGWAVFTSANGVRVFFEGLRKNRTDIRAVFGLKFACIGRATAEELLKHGIYADLIPERYTAGDLGRELAERLAAGKKGKADKEGCAVTDNKVLILRAEGGSTELLKELEACGTTYKDVHIYRTETEYAKGALISPDTCTGPEDLLMQGYCVNSYDNAHAEGPDYIVFGSAGGVRAWKDQIIFMKEKGIAPLPVKKAVCIGKYTADALNMLMDEAENDGIKEYFPEKSVTAETFSAEGIIKAMIRDRQREDLK
mgnify:CR=1 FL=1